MQMEIDSKSEPAEDDECQEHGEGVQTQQRGVQDLRGGRADGAVAVEQRQPES